MTELFLNWYRKNKRDLPWRKRSDPYAVLVSELMLQQTRVDTVIAYYNAFMARFPDVFALANADEADVLHAWQGLGYYSRARNLHKLAQEVVEVGGVFPTTYHEWQKLPGVGRYIAGAVMSIAQGQVQSAVDGNVLRVISRIDGCTDDISLPASRKKIESRVSALMPTDNTSDFTQALMELGALVCKPTSPLCADCPLRENCTAFKEGTTAQIPVKSPKRKPQRVMLWALAIICGEYILLKQRGDKELLAKMWGVPVFERTDDDFETASIENLLDLKLPRAKDIGCVTHVFTHRLWEMRVQQFYADDFAKPAGNWEWVSFDALPTKAIPTAFAKVLNLVKKTAVQNKPI